MERTYINEVQKEIGSTVKVRGFIENLRNSKYMAFIVLKDITGKLQITVEKADHPDLVDTIDKLTPDSVITVTGKVMENDYVKMGGVEMIPESIEVYYIWQSVFGMLLFYGIGFGFGAGVGLVYVVLIAAGVWIVQALFSSVWLYFCQFCPLEWIWRMLTYGKVFKLIKEENG